VLDFLVAIIVSKAGPAQLGSIVLAKSRATLQARGRVKIGSSGTGKITISMSPRRVFKNQR
jgi:hypothetical protein